LLGAAAVLHQMTGDAAGADSAVAVLDSLHDQEESHHLSWFRLMGHAGLAMVRGETAGAAARLRAAAEIPLMPAHRSIALRNLALCDALAGRGDDAVARAEAAARLARTDGTERVFGLLSYVPGDLPLAVAARAEGQWSRAEDLAHSALAEVQAVRGPLYTRAATLLALSSIWAHRDRHEEAVRLAAGVRANCEREGVVWDAVATAGYDAGCLDVARGALGDEAVDDLWAEGTAMSWDELIAYGQRGWGVRNRAVYGWDALTPTERQVAGLVVAGATNKEVAARLFMSVATVKTHLTRVYTKVGVTSRTQLAAAARE
jgi:DNA-binding CsgD family transcriptional regulator